MNAIRRATTIAMILMILAAVTSVAQANVNLRGLTTSEYQAAFDTWVPLGYRPTKIDSYVLRGIIRYDLTMEQANGPGWVAHHNMDSIEFQNRTRQYASQGYTIKIYTSVRLNGQLWHTALWVRR